MRSLFSRSVLVFAASVAPALAAISFTTSGVYDDPTTTNAVDSFSLAGGDTYANYTAAFATAYAANNGGVLNFDSAGITSTAVTDATLLATYGVSGANTLTITGGSIVYNYQTAAVGLPISGNGFMRISSTNALHVYNFASPLSMVGITVLSRSAARTVTVTATYDNGETAIRANEAIAGVDGTDDTFFGFTAPAGRTISRLELNAGNGNFFAVDDLGFVVAVPEPAAALLGSLGALGLLRRRR